MSDKTKRNEMRECWSCQSKRSVPGSCHISCATPDNEMEGDKQGVNGGWFFYPHNFDPVWKKKLCQNYKEE